MQNQSTTFAPLPSARYEITQGDQNICRVPAVKVERLPFTVKLVSTKTELRKAIKVRQAAYARHTPLFAQSLKAPEAMDEEKGVILLLAESKTDGTPLGTMRIQTNRFQPLSLEQSIRLPSWLEQRPLAEATRLGVTNEKIGRLVKTILFKAFYQYCITRGIEWMVVAGRAPVDRQYDQLLFKDVYPGMGYIPLQHAGNMPHRVLSLDVRAAESEWTEAAHPLLDFMCNTHHPDIDIGARAPTLVQ